MKFFEIDSPLMTFLGKMADLLWLNILTMICCIPIITVGASLSALNYMALKIVRDEECYITKGFFKSFKENFKQGTAIWAFFLVIILILGGDYYIIFNQIVNLNRVIRIGIMALTLLVVFTWLYVFPFQAKFSNTVRRTITNAFMMSILQFPKTLCMIVFYLAPFVLGYLVQQVIPLCFLFCFSLPAFLSALLYNKPFKKLEDQILAAQNGEFTEDGAQPEDDGRIFHDEADETAADANVQTADADCATCPANPE